MTAAALFAAVALLPAMTGPLGGAEQASLQVLLCGGGALSIPLDGTPASHEGCAKGCHSSSCRKRFDRAQ